MRLLQSMAEAFNARAIPWCVLHNYEGFPQHNVGRDIDILVSPDCLDSAVNALCASSEVRVTSILRRTESVHVFTSGVNGCGLQLHLMFKLAWKGQCYLDAASILDRRTRFERLPFLYIADECDDALFSLCESYVWDGVIKQAYRQKISATLSAHRDEAISRMGAHIGPRLASYIVDTVAAGHYDAAISLVPYFRLALLRRSFGHNKLEAAGNVLRYFAREVLLRADPRLTFQVAVLGVDGAGKSTLVRSLRASLRDTVASVEPIRFRPHILYDRSGADFVPPAGVNPHTCPRANWFTSAVKLLIWSVELFLAKYLLPKRTATLRLYDRYYHDAFIDPSRYGLDPPRWLAHLMSRIAPEPDLWILLDVPPTIAIARKNEIPLDELRQERERYLSFLHDRDNALIIDATNAPEAVHATIRDAIIARLAGRISMVAGTSPEVPSLHATVTNAGACDRGDTAA